MTILRDHVRRLTELVERQYTASPGTPMDMAQPRVEAAQGDPPTSAPPVRGEGQRITQWPLVEVSQLYTGDTCPRNWWENLEMTVQRQNAWDDDTMGRAFIRYLGPDPARRFQSELREKGVSHLQASACMEWMKNLYGHRLEGRDCESILRRLRVMNPDETCVLFMDRIASECSRSDEPRAKEFDFQKGSLGAGLKNPVFLIWFTQCPLEVTTWSALSDFMRKFEEQYLKVNRLMPGVESPSLETPEAGGSNLIRVVGTDQGRRRPHYEDKAGSRQGGSNMLVRGRSMIQDASA